MLAEVRSEIMKQECKVVSLNTCTRELQRQAHSQRLELDEANCGNEESRRARPIRRRIGSERESTINRDVRNLVLLSKISSDHQQSGRTPDSRLSVLSPAVLETCTVRVRAERRTGRGSLGVHRASQSSHACLSLSGLACGLLLRPYLSLVHVLHSRLRSLDATPAHEEGCAQQLCRHGVRCRKCTKGVVSSP